MSHAEWSFVFMILLVVSICLMWLAGPIMSYHKNKNIGLEKRIKRLENKTNRRLRKIEKKIKE